MIPSNRISSISQQIQALYPAPNNPGTNNGLQNNLFLPRTPTGRSRQLRRQGELEQEHDASDFAKFSTMRAEGVEPLSCSGVDEGGLGDTNAYVATVGHTWSLSPTMLIDGNFGMNWQDQTAAGLGLRHELRDRNVRDSRDERSGSASERHASLQRPVCSTGSGNNAHLASARAPREELHDHDEPDEAGGRARVPRRVRLHPLPAESLAAGTGVGPARAFSTSRATSPGQPGYTSNAWNQYAAFLLGRTSGYGKSIQFEEMSGRENQYGVFVSDRWTVSEKLTLNLGSALRILPADDARRIAASSGSISAPGTYCWAASATFRRMSASTSARRSSPLVWAPPTASTRRRCSAPATASPTTRCRGRVRFAASTRSTIGFSQNATASNFASFPLADGIPPVPLPDTSTGRIPFPRNVETRTPNPDDVDRGRIAAVERHAGAAVPARTSMSPWATSEHGPMAATPT